MNAVVTVHRFLPDHSAGTEVVVLGIVREALVACIRRVASDRALLRRRAARTRVPDSGSAHVDALESIDGGIVDARTRDGLAPAVA